MTHGPQRETAAVAVTLGALTIEEKTALTAGRDFWQLYGVERIGSDSVPATCFPTASALAASCG